MDTENLNKESKANLNTALIVFIIAASILGFHFLLRTVACFGMIVTFLCRKYRRHQFIRKKGNYEDVFDLKKVNNSEYEALHHKTTYNANTNMEIIYGKDEKIIGVELKLDKMSGTKETPVVDETFKSYLTGVYQSVSGENSPPGDRERVLTSPIDEFGYTCPDSPKQKGSSKKKGGDGTEKK